MDLESMVKEKYPKAKFIERYHAHLNKYTKVCSIANHDGDGVVKDFDVAFISAKGKYWTYMTLPKR